MKKNGYEDSLKEKEWYEERLAKGVSLEKMAKELGLGSCSAVRNHLKRHGLFVASRKANYSVAEREVVERMAIEGKTDEEIAEALNRPVQGVAKQRAKFVKYVGGNRPKGTKVLPGRFGNSAAYLSKPWAAMCQS